MHDLEVYLINLIFTNTEIPEVIQLFKCDMGLISLVNQAVNIKQTSFNDHDHTPKNRKYLLYYFEYG